MILFVRTDTDAEIALVIELAKEAGAYDAVECTHWADGGKLPTSLSRHRLLVYFGRLSVASRKQMTCETTMEIGRLLTRPKIILVILESSQLCCHLKKCQSQTGLKSIKMVPSNRMFLTIVLGEIWVFCLPKKSLRIEGRPIHPHCLISW